MNGKRAKQIRSRTSSRKEYQAAKRAAVKAPTLAAQNPTPLPVRNHKPKAPIAATWPHTKDQHKQTRPIIVMHPVRALRNSFLSRNSPDPTTGQRSLTENQVFFLSLTMGAPKHRIDQLAIRHA